MLQSSRVYFADSHRGAESDREGSRLIFLAGGFYYVPFPVLMDRLSLCVLSLCSFGLLQVSLSPIWHSPPVSPGGGVRPNVQFGHPHTVLLLSEPLAQALVYSLAIGGW